MVKRSYKITSPINLTVETSSVGIAKDRIVKHLIKHGHLKNNAQLTLRITQKNPDKTIVYDIKTGSGSKQGVHGKGADKTRIKYTAFKQSDSGRKRKRGVTQDKKTKPKAKRAKAATTTTERAPKKPEKPEKKAVLPTKKRGRGRRGGGGRGGIERPAVQAGQLRGLQQQIARMQAQLDNKDRELITHVARQKLLLQNAELANKQRRAAIDAKVEGQTRERKLQEKGEREIARLGVERVKFQQEAEAQARQGLELQRLEFEKQRRSRERKIREDELQIQRVGQTTTVEAQGRLRLMQQELITLLARSEEKGVDARARTATRIATLRSSIDTILSGNMAERAISEGKAFEQTTRIQVAQRAVPFQTQATISESQARIARAGASVQSSSLQARSDRLVSDAEVVARLAKATAERVASQGKIFTTIRSTNVRAAMDQSSLETKAAENQSRQVVLRAKAFQQVIKTQVDQAVAPSLVSSRQAANREKAIRDELKTTVQRNAVITSKANAASAKARTAQAESSARAALQTEAPGVAAKIAAAKSKARKEQLNETKAQIAFDDAASQFGTNLLLRKSKTTATLASDERKTAIEQLATRTARETQQSEVERINAENRQKASVANVKRITTTVEAKRTQVVKDAKLTQQLKLLEVKLDQARLKFNTFHNVAAASQHTLKLARSSEQLGARFNDLFQRQEADHKLQTLNWNHEFLKGKQQLRMRELALQGENVDQKAATESYKLWLTGMNQKISADEKHRSQVDINAARLRLINEKLPVAQRRANEARLTRLEAQGVGVDTALNQLRQGFAENVRMAPVEAKQDAKRTQQQLDVVAITPTVPPVVSNVPAPDTPMAPERKQREIKRQRRRSKDLSAEGLVPSSSTPTPIVDQKGADRTGTITGSLTAIPTAAQTRDELLERAGALSPVPDPVSRAPTPIDDDEAMAAARDKRLREQQNILVKPAGRAPKRARTVPDRLPPREPPIPTPAVAPPPPPPPPLPQVRVAFKRTPNPFAPVPLPLPTPNPNRAERKNTVRNLKMMDRKGRLTSFKDSAHIIGGSRRQPRAVRVFVNAYIDNMESATKTPLGLTGRNKLALTLSKDPNFKTAGTSTQKMRFTASAEYVKQTMNLATIVKGTPGGKKFSDLRKKLRNGEIFIRADLGRHGLKDRTANDVVSLEDRFMVMGKDDIIRHVDKNIEERNYPNNNSANLTVIDFIPTV